VPKKERTFCPPHRVRRQWQFPIFLGEQKDWSARCGPLQHQSQQKFYCNCKDAVIHHKM